ncbi:DUF1376 domain-containing protein [Methylorubrum sp. SB2]|uniref:DUF1376 domain-containing protein n=1 Tax=Methylorubrum subtropicum TaxID=3138812 RepID=UPI00313EF225
MVGFYKHDIPAWMDGTEALSDGAYRVYHVVIQLIMLNEGPIALNERGLAGRCNQTLKLFLRHLDELVRAGKLVVAAGRIENARAARELDSVRKNRENAGKGGKISGQRRNPSADLENEPAKPLENNDQDEAPLHKDRSLKEKRREDSPKAPKGAEPEGFAEWWEAYPPRDGANPRAPAAARYALALKAGVLPETLLAAVRAYAAELRRAGKTNTEYVKQAQFWLSPKDRQWEDYAAKAEALAARQAGTAPGAADMLASLSDDRWRSEVQMWRSRGGHWPLGRLTPPPDTPGTKVPPSILAEFGLAPRSRAAA